MNPQVPLNNTSIDTITPKAADGSQQNVGSLTVTIDDYATAYVAKYPGTSPNGFIVVPKNPAQVGTKTVTVTAHATDLDGNSLPAGTQSFDIVGATPPPLATTLVMGTPQVGAFPGVPPDPGSSTATLV
jgi:hypothetical protein